MSTPTNTTPPPDNTPLVDTNGWHTVAAVTYRDINKSIAAQKASPSTWAETISDTSGSVSVTGGTFGLWQIATGGAGGNLVVSIPLTGGTLTGVGADPVPIPNCTAKVILKLNYLPQPGDNGKQDLRVSLKAPGGEDVASVEELLPRPGFKIDALLKELLENWLNEHLDSFTAIFATVDLAADFAHKGMNWLQPSWYGYAVAEPPQDATPDNSVFAVLCLIGGQTNAPNLAYQVSPYAIPKGADAAFLIAPEMVLRNIMMPSMPLMFKGILNQPPEANFSIDNGGTRISSLEKLTMGDFKMPNGKVVDDATVDASQFTVEIDGTELVITANDISFGYSPGISVKLSFSGRHALGFDSHQDVMVLSATKYSGSGSVQISRGLDIALISLAVFGIVTSIVAVVGGTVAKTASKAITTATEAATITATAAADAVQEDAPLAAEVTVTCLRGLISGNAVEVAAIGARFATVVKVALVAGIAGGALAIPELGVRIAKFMADGDYQATPKLSDLANAAVGKAVVWPTGVPHFTLASARLNGALQMGLVEGELT